MVKPMLALIMCLPSQSTSHQHKTSYKIYLNEVVIDFLIFYPLAEIFNCCHCFIPKPFFLSFTILKHF